MNLRQLKTLVAVAENRSLSAAAQAVGLTHSAVSVQIKALETELGISLLDRSRRPPILTDRGHLLVERAREMVTLLDEIASLGSEEQLVGSLTLGVVPSAMIHLLPPALSSLRDSHPKVKLSVKSALSGNLSQLVLSGQIDAAVVTSTSRLPKGLKARVITTEPLVVIAHESANGETDEQVISENPFIWFNRETWAGQQIERFLLNRGLGLQEFMEVDSLEAIEAMVSEGLGVSVVPVRKGHAFPDNLRVIPFGDPQEIRSLSLLERSANPKARLTEALFNQLNGPEMVAQA